MVNNIVITLYRDRFLLDPGSHSIMYAKAKWFSSTPEVNILLYIQHFNKNSLKKMQGHTEQVDSTRVFMETVGLQVSIICQS